MVCLTLKLAYFSAQAVGNAGTLVLGSSYQLKLFPESKHTLPLFVLRLIIFYHAVVACIVVSMFASALVHRVCVTTWYVGGVISSVSLWPSLPPSHKCARSLLFSLVALYYINRISQAAYGQSTSQLKPTTTAVKSKKEKGKKD